MHSRENSKHIDTNCVSLLMSQVASMMVGIDIATGLSDALINRIVQYVLCCDVTCIDSSNLLALGVCSHKQAEEILYIIRTYSHI